MAVIPAGHDRHLVRTEKERPEATEPDRWVVAPLHDPEREQGWQDATFIALPDRHQWAPPQASPELKPALIPASGFDLSAGKG